LEVDAMNKAGQLKVQKQNAEIAAFAKAGDIKTKREQMQMQQRNQQKEKTTK
jgi:hypothetical protein